MLKYVLLAATATMSVPALAQTSPTPPSTAATPLMDPASQTTATPPSDPMADTSTTPATDPAAQTPATPATQSAEAAPADAGGVSSVVDQEFASYDKDSNGSLSKAEFGAWLDALKAKSPDAAKTGADPKYNDNAFAQADTDKSKALSKGELTAFLSPKAPS